MCPLSKTGEKTPLQSLPEHDLRRPDRFPIDRQISARISRSTVGIVIASGLVFFYFGSLPIWHTDVWGHLNYGRDIWENHSLPTSEPRLPFAREMPFVDSAWLSQLIGYTVVRTRSLGLAGLQGLLALGVTGSFALLACSTYRQTQNGWFSILSGLCFLTTSRSPLTVLRPQLAGLVCFILILTRVVRRPNSGIDRIVVPLIFAFWANLHGSFLIGVGLLASASVGHALDILIRTRSLRRAIAGSRARRFCSLTLLASASVLLNPYTTRLYHEVIWFSACENLADLTEWQPLSVRDEQGFVFAVVSVLLVVVYRISPRRVPCWEFFALGGLSFATLWSSRMIVWWSPVASLLLTRHVFSIWRSFRHLPFVSNPSSRSWIGTLFSTSFALTCFMLTPLGMALMLGRHEPTRKSVSSDTPVFAAEYLHLHPPDGPVFNTYEWGDYLQWAGPRDLPLFVNSHAHLIPREVWRDYMRVIELREGWEETLDRYGFTTIVIDRANRESLIQALGKNPKWKSPPVEQEGQVIFLRK